MVKIAELQPTQLPGFDSPRVRQLGLTADSDRYNAYTKILQAEEYALRRLREAEDPRRATECRPTVKEARGELVAVRVAGYFFLEFETHSLCLGVAASQVLVNWLVSPSQSAEANHYDVVIGCGTMLRDGLVRSFRTSTTAYPVSSSRSSRASFESLVDMIQGTMEARDQTTTIRDKVLARDHHRCVVTGIYDATSVRRCRELRHLHVARSRLQMAHIFNESTMHGIKPEDCKDSKTVYASSTLAILSMFGYSKFVDTFSSGDVHEPWNLLFLHYDARCLFDRLELWLEHTDTPNRYEICFANADDVLSIRCFFEHDRQVGDDGRRRFVEFNATYEDVPPPDPLLLALHATCARVAHMSGAAELFDQVERDKEEIGVLASDGSSSTLLEHLLSPFATPIFE